MYRQTDALFNIGLDNSKDEREAEAAKRRTERLERAKAHTAASLTGSMNRSFEGSMGISPIKGFKANLA